MGGRGGSGGGSNSVASLKIPEITSGSEKQRSYARDIIEGPYNKLLSEFRSEQKLRDADVAYAKKNGKKIPSPSAEYEAARAAVSRYASEVSKIGSIPGAKIDDARWVIDNKVKFSMLGQGILDDEKRKRRK